MEFADDIHIALASTGLSVSSGSEILEFCKQGIASPDYRALVVCLCDQLRKFLNLEESLENSDDTASFALELTGFLRELDCPIDALMAFDQKNRFLDSSNCLALLDYLTTEIQSLRLIAKKSPDYLKKATAAAVPQASSKDSTNAFHLQKMCRALGFPKPPPNIAAQEFCTKIFARVQEVVSSWPPELLGKALVQTQIAKSQWESLVALNEIFTEEYAIRREMLLTRFDVTIRSFGWGNPTRSKDIEKVYLPLRQLMRIRTGLGVASVLAARDDLTRIRKTCDVSLRERTKCHINKATMGAVPDRGGRANEYDAPPPEMPQWQKRQPDSGFRGRGGRGGGHRGGRGGGGGHGGHGNVFDRLDGGRPHTAGNVYGGGGAYYQDPYQQQQHFQPQSNFDQFGGGGGGGYQQDNRSYSAGRGGRGGRRGHRH